MPHISQLTKIEILCEKRFHEEFGNGTLWGEYLVARGKMFTEILPYIRAKEPRLTDHEDRHPVSKALPRGIWKWNSLGRVFGGSRQDVYRNIALHKGKRALAYRP